MNTYSRRPDFLTSQLDWKEIGHEGWAPALGFGTLDFHQPHPGDSPSGQGFGAGL